MPTWCGCHSEEHDDGHPRRRPVDYIARLELKGIDYIVEELALFDPATSAYLLKLDAVVVFFGDWKRSST